MNTRRYLPALALPFLAVAQASFAHPLASAHTHGLTQGLSHPLLGLDHMLAMLAIGLWASQRGGKSVWALPAAFLGFMTLGGVLGMSGLALPGVESGVAASVLILGLIVLAAVRMPMVVSLGLAAVFALLHGHSHGTELGGTVGAFTYGVGFLCSTALLHAAGVAAGFAIKSEGRQAFVRAAGASIALVGICMIGGLL